MFRRLSSQLKKFCREESMLEEIRYQFDLDWYFSAVEGNRFLPEPPPDRDYVGNKEFRAIGAALAKRLVRSANLSMDGKVLDIGSGIGRVAVPLTQWLSSSGRYVGIEVVLHGVAWCIENISSKYPNFSFVHADLKNDYYNPSGQVTTQNFVLPADCTDFDVAFFASVFTHLDSNDTEAWIGKATKALKPGGRIYSTWFIMDDETIESCKSGDTMLNFCHEDNGVFWLSPERSSVAVAFAPWRIHAMLEKHGLAVVEWLRGNWCTRAEQTGGLQDEILVVKK